NHRFKPSELATIAVGDAAQTLEVARYLVPKGAPAADAVGTLIDEAAHRGASSEEGLLLKADMALALEHYGDARVALQEGRRLAPQDGRFDERLSMVAEREGNLEEALAAARTATIAS